MSTLKAEVVTVREVTNHPNADRLDLLRFNEYDWVVVTSKVEVPSALPDISYQPEDGAVATLPKVEYVPRYKPGDILIYIPIDSILPPKLECYLFPPDSKIKLSKSRVRSIKIRKCVSQGMTIDLVPELFELYPQLKNARLGDDVTEILGITKYEAPAAEIPGRMNGQARKYKNENFKTYTDIDHFKRYPHTFTGKLVYVTEKLHGTSARYAVLPRGKRNFKNFKHFVENTRLPYFHPKMLGSYLKVLKLIAIEIINEFYLTLKDNVLTPLNCMPAYEYCFGSRNVQLQDKPKEHTGFYDENVYAIVGQQLDLRNKLKPNEALYGEIVGHGIQSNYTYGCKEGEYKFYAYDVQVDGRYLNCTDFLSWCKDRDIQHVPVLCVAEEFDYEKLDKMRTGDSLIGGQKVREGIVIKPFMEEVHPEIGRNVLKWINDDYLLKDDNTDFH